MSAYFDNLTAQVSECRSCADLQRVIDKTFAGLAAEKAGITSQIAALAPMLELLSLNPTDLPSVLTFVVKLRDELLGPYLAPYAKYLTQLTELIAAIASLESAITNAASNISGCSISIPSI